ncbi:MAG TPA: HD domain-containing phosphohydrolase [Alphaproteobacteria bacterium]|nr:HD domain-containing phosphohydrolase [Alphaproteobacteria bacterium]
MTTRLAAPIAIRLPQRAASGAAAALLDCASIGAHEQGVACLARGLALAMGHGDGFADAVATAGLLHDIGKSAVPDRILNHPGRLSEGDWAVLRRHTVYGHDMLATLGGEELALAASVALHHHEGWDGSGYHGLRGAAIPLAARLVTICDVYDALREDRAYKAGMGHDEACTVIAFGDARLDPRQFDPAVHAAFLAGADRLRAEYEALER